MRIGIGMPNPVPGTPGDRLVEWARRAEERGFTGLATIDRIAYPTHDSLVTLAAAAAVTSRIGLMTNILLCPVYPTVVVAKAAASIDQISHGRFTLGVAAGSREDDFALAGRSFPARGVELDAGLELMHRAWRGDPMTADGHTVTPSPTTDHQVPVMIGGYTQRAVRRVVQWGVGWTAGGVPPHVAGGFAERIRDAWQRAGRKGEPRVAALTYFSLGEAAEQDSRRYLRDYYGYTGEHADRIAESALRDSKAIRGAVQGYADAGITELYFDPTVPDLEQVDRLADLVL